MRYIHVVACRGALVMLYMEKRKLHGEKTELTHNLTLSENNLK